MTNKYTVERLQDTVKRCQLAPEKARARLVEFRDLIDSLITCKNDKTRVKIFNKIDKFLHYEYSTPEDLVMLSALANPSEETLAGIATRKAMHAKVAEDQKARVVKMAAILAEKTGIDPALAQKIMHANFWSKEFQTDWPVSDEVGRIGTTDVKFKVVTGPLGTLPLQAPPGIPGWDAFQL